MADLVGDPNCCFSYAKAHMVCNYGNLPMQYTDIFSTIKTENFLRKNNNYYVSIILLEALIVATR